MTAQPLLSLVRSDNTSTTTLPAKDVIGLYAEHLMKLSWCIDVSSHPIKALHADSNYNAAPENFKYEFPSWARANKVRVDTGEYQKFLSSLVDRLIPMLPRVVGSSFRPIPEKFFTNSGATFANTYVPFRPTVPDVFVMPDILSEYLDRIFMNDEDRKRIVEFMADIIQNPARRPQWAVVITGAQGTGKSSLFRLVSAALGNRHTWEHNEYTPAFKQFSEVLPDNLLVSFDDAPADNKSTYHKLKQAITRTSMSVELKGVQKPVQRDVYARIMICSNNPRPLRIEEGDRRLYVCEPCQHTVSPEETAAFFVRFNDWLDHPDTPTTLFHWLSKEDLRDFVHGSTVKTATHAQMVGLSTTVLETHLKDYVQDSQIFHGNQLMQYLDEQGCRRPDGDLLKLKMAALNYQQVRRAVPGCGETQHYLWQPIPTGRRARALKPDEAKAIQAVLSPTY
ncbi:primase-helicase family protein [Cupriavidus sp. SW-Y-13]|uniref:primase-helicase family protein n=1 Tax=Cupriavidus sp. SW-Y-13 TaxID=2653854 RepID=UPI001365D753|nr:primase-helicase family protein [Cupriavidus sp. SW-Y-13]MWL87679.1 hypothetical protein [Cupriavidus sp. SW-Y-13]